jgi:3,4-dihydroxy 2-butanone 4-phosphate synthase/GTP cyclohydrolase II
MKIRDDARYVVHPLSTTLLGEVAAVVFNFADARSGDLALIAGEIGQRPLVRIQSRCVYGEVFQSHHCDCREQLERSADLIREEGSGILVYVDQEGRGAGLATKAKAYQASAETGIDTFSYYEGLGMASDPRTYEHVVSLLSELGVTEVRLLTNNPAKLTALIDAGMRASRVPIVVETHALASDYLAAKRKQGHLL